MKQRYSLRILLLPLFLIYFPSLAFATSTGPNSPATMADDATVGTTAWSNPNNAKVSDNVYATASPGGGVLTHYLMATNFNFSIPAGATIDGIVVEIEKKSDNGGATADNIVKIIKGGVLGSANKASAANWPGADAYKSYGGTGDLWGETWSYSDVNAANFGIVISAGDVFHVGESANLSVDHIRITVYYTEAAPPAAIPAKAHLGPAHIGSGRF